MRSVARRIARLGFDNGFIDTLDQRANLGIRLLFGDREPAEPARFGNVAKVRRSGDRAA